MPLHTKISANAIASHVAHLCALYPSEQPRCKLLYMLWHNSTNRQHAQGVLTQQEEQEFCGHLGMVQECCIKVF